MIRYSFIQNQILNIYAAMPAINFPLNIKGILAPVIVFKELNVKSAKEVSDLSGLPIDIAAQRYERLLMLQERSAFETSRLESIVLSQFKGWISRRL